MWPEFARQRPAALLPSCVVDTNESLRQRALRLVTLGCSQKILAAKMGMQASTFSRWLNQKSDVAPVSVTALDGFNAYVLELQEALSEDRLHAIRQSDVASVPGAPAPIAKTLQKGGGEPLALPAPARGRRRSVQSAAKRLSAEFERATQEEERRQARAARKHTAAAPRKAAGGRARAAKNLR